MAKYLIISDFEATYQVRPDGPAQVVIFPKGNVVEAAKSPVDGSIVTTTSGEMPNFQMSGQVWIPLVMEKVKLLEDPKSDNTKKWLYLGGAAILLWWFIYGRDTKKRPNESPAGFP